MHSACTDVGGARFLRFHEMRAGAYRAVVQKEQPTLHLTYVQNVLQEADNLRRKLVVAQQLVQKLEVQLDQVIVSRCG